MESLSSNVRMHNLARLEKEPFDIVVIGGGVTGAGVALDAAARGYKVALLEKSDFASGTSSKSTKLVHGGIRYLPNFDFGLVREALIERGFLLQNAPFLVNPLPFVLPIYEGDRHPVGMPFTTPGGIGLGRLLDLGLWLYDGLAGRRNVDRHRHISRAEVMRLAPLLVTNGLKDGFVYYDAQTNDARLTMAIMRTAAQYGVVIANYAEITGFVTEDGKVKGVNIHDRLTDRRFETSARYMINATGVYSEMIEEMTGATPQAEIVPSKGVHLVLDRKKLQIGDSAIVLPETDDKRILFIVPWESRVIFGTTDTGTGDLDHPSASQDDINYLLGYLNRYLSVDLTQEDIISVYAGYRPLVRPRGSKSSTAKLSRSHAVLENPSGLISIVGGKLTTYRRMAQDTMDIVSKRDGLSKPLHPTQQIPLQGSAGWLIRKRELQDRGEALGLDPDVIKHLGHSYGTEAEALYQYIDEEVALAERLIPDLPYIRAEVIYACRREMAMKPEDVIARRTSIILEDQRSGLEALEDIVSLMGRELEWSTEQQQDMIQSSRGRLEPQKAAEKI
ncbi:MAG TPA: glycerol-3-phosphate dehydrogenase/oxidase [Ktedonobacteraceae bacterium]|nr:glycerol-3-phosphate dehydrogenase/oxidase [Ktedonobacteraceae bacterium]